LTLAGLPLPLSSGAAGTVVGSVVFETRPTHELSPDDLNELV